MNTTKSSAQSIARIKELQQPTETKNYIVKFNEQKQRWELTGKLLEGSYFMKACQFQAPLLVAQRDLEAKRV